LNDKRSQQPKRPATPPGGIISWFRNWQGLVSVILLFLTLEMVVLSLESADWINPQPMLTLVLVVSFIIAGLLIRSRLPGIIAHIIALGAGAGVTAWQTYMLPSSNTMSFAAFLSFLTWIMGYFSVWYLVRRQNPWVAVIMGTIVVLVNLSNLPESYYYFFGLYFLAAIFLVTWVRMRKQHIAMGRTRGSTIRGLLSLGALLTCIVVVAVFAARVMPDVRIPQLQTLIAKNMLWKQDLEDSVFNMFEKVPSKQPSNTANNREDLVFGSIWKQREDVEFIISSPKPSYWRVKLYDTYTTRGWENRSINDEVLESHEAWDNGNNITDGDIITYTVATRIKTDILLTAGDFISADTTALVGVSYGDVMTVRIPRVISPGEHYNVTSMVSVPSPGALATVNEGYPESLSQQYVRLPANFPDAISDLSRELTANATTPYEKVVAIDAYLSRFAYDEQIEPPPPGVDGVEHFLFTEKSGFCLYFASSMAVMLRSVDVPARLAVGYIPGEPGENEDEYILRSNHYHAWPQVYFDGYGWVDIEATPSSGGSEVAIEEPWVAASTPIVYPDYNIPNPWELAQSQAPWYGSIPEPEEKPKRISSRFAFADELGQVLIVLSIILGILLALAVPFSIVRSSIRRWVWRVDRSDLASSIYLRMSRLASLGGMSPEPQQTPQEFAAALSAEYPDQGEAFNDIARTYAETRFGRKEGKLELYEEARVLKSRRNAYNPLMRRMGWLVKLFGKG
jgi:hypothetical protein